MIKHFYPENLHPTHRSESRASLPRLAPPYRTGGKLGPHGLRGMQVIGPVAQPPAQFFMRIKILEIQGTTQQTTITPGKMLARMAE
jgi:hypothetical protein